MALKGMWKLYETSTGTITDYSGNSLNGVTGTIASGDMGKQGKFQKSILFDSSSDSIRYNNSNEVPAIPLTSISTHIWYNKNNVAWLSNTSRQTIFTILTNRDSGGTSLLYTYFFGNYDGASSKYGYQDVSPSNLNVTGDNTNLPSDFRWHSYGYSHSGTSVKIYVDGVLKLSGTTNTYPTTTLYDRSNGWFGLGIDTQALNARLCNFEWHGDEKPASWFKNQYAFGNGFI